MDDHHHHRHFNKKRLIYAIILTGLMFVIEIVGGFLTHSLALLSDAAHMFSHLFALGISYTAIIISLRPADPQRTYGYYRAEILAAFVNGISLFVIIFAILYGAYERFKNPVDIRATEMFIISITGLLVNLATAALLRSGSRSDINVKGAFLHALGDMISSVGVVAAAIVIQFTHLYIIDTIVSIFIALIIVYWAISLIKDSTHILLEGTPKNIPIDEVVALIKKIVARESIVHHIHAWQISTNIYALTAHISVDHIDPHEATRSLRLIKEELEHRYHIHHTTIQFECLSCKEFETIIEPLDGHPCPTLRK